MVTIVEWVISNDGFLNIYIIWIKWFIIYIYNINCILKWKMFIAFKKLGCFNVKVTKDLMNFDYLVQIYERFYSCQ
jgi:hypothetical protein